MLIEEVILALVINQSVGIIVPAAARREVELRAQSLVVEVLGAFDLIR